MRKYRVIRFVSLAMLICIGLYVHRLSDEGNILNNTRSLLDNIILAVFFLIDLILTLLTKETLLSAYGVTKENSPRFYYLCVGFDILIIIIMASLALKRYSNM